MGTNRLWTTIHSYQEIFNCRTCSNVSRTSFTLVWSSLQATGFVCICGNRMDTKLMGILKSMKIQVLLIKLASSCLRQTDQKNILTLNIHMLFTGNVILNISVVTKNFLGSINFSCENISNCHLLTYMQPEDHPV